MLQYGMQSPIFLVMRSRTRQCILSHPIWCCPTPPRGVARAKDLLLSREPEMDVINLDKQNSFTSEMDLLEPVLRASCLLLQTPICRGLCSPEQQQQQRPPRLAFFPYHTI